jgi:hypothetical protein
VKQKKNLDGFQARLDGILHHVLDLLVADGIMNISYAPAYRVQQLRRVRKKSVVVGELEEGFHEPLVDMPT